MGLIGRDRQIRRFRKCAANSEYDYFAIFGLPGVGKTTFIQEVFSEEAKKKLATENKRLVIYNSFKRKYSATELKTELYALVQRALLLMPKEDLDIVNAKVSEVGKADDSIDLKLLTLLGAVNSLDYRVLILLDHFHNMGKDSDQYDVLRSFTEDDNTGISFWLLTDADFRENCDPDEENPGSLFIHKFDKTETLKPIADTEDNAYATMLAEQYDSEELLNTAVHEMIAELLGGVPELVRKFTQSEASLMAERDIRDQEDILKLIMRNDAVMNVFSAWLTGLTERDKYALCRIAASEGLSMHDMDWYHGKVHRLGELGDKTGRGLIHVDLDDDLNPVYSIGIPAFREYLLAHAEEYKDADGTTLLSALGEGDSFTNLMRQAQANGTPVIVQIVNQTVNNNNFEAGSQQIVNNIVDSESLHEALLQLSGMRDALEAPLAIEDASSKSKAENLISCLAPKEEELAGMTDEQRDERFNAYADAVLDSADYAGKLSEREALTFGITYDKYEAIVDSISAECACLLENGIRIYNLLQYFIDKFGLDLSQCESVRGILFARAFERHGKEVMIPVFQKIWYLGNIINQNGVCMCDLTAEKMTIGNFSYAIKTRSVRGYLATDALHYEGSVCNASWWAQYYNLLNNIGTKRNDCCHSGHRFDHNDLKLLIRMLFDEDAFLKQNVFKELCQKGTSVAENSGHAAQSNTLTGTISIPAEVFAAVTEETSPVPDDNAANVESTAIVVNADAENNPPSEYVGRTNVEFVMKKKRTNGGISGVVFGTYPASMSKKAAEYVNYTENGTVLVRIEAINQNPNDPEKKYIVKPM